MTFPVVEQIVRSNSNSDGTSKTVVLPATINANDILIAFLSCDGNPTVYWDNNTANRKWAKLADAAGPSNAQKLSIWWCRAIGTEDGASLTITLSASERAAWQIYRISGADTELAPEVSTIASNTNTAPTPGSLSPSWGTADTLWMVAFGADAATADASGYAYPTNYTTNGIYDEANNTAGCGLGSSYRTNNASSETPGAWTINTSEQWTAYTIAIAPAGTYIGTQDVVAYFSGGSTQLPAGGYTSSSFTPANNSLLAVLVTGGDNFSSSRTITGGSLSWTLRASKILGNGDTWAEIYTAPITTGTSMTVGYSADVTIQSIVMHVAAITGYNTSSPIGAKMEAGAASSRSGSYAGVLNASASNTSIIIGIGSGDVGTPIINNGGTTAGTGYEQLSVYRAGDNQTGAFLVGRNRSDTAVNFGMLLSDNSWAAVAVEIKQASSSSISGTSSLTLSNFTSTTTGTINVNASLSKTISNFTSSSTGTVNVIGTFSKSISDFILVSNININSLLISNIALTNFSISSTGIANISSISNYTISNFSLSTNGIVNVSSIISKTADNFTISSNGTANIIGATTKILSDFILVSNTVASSSLILNSNLDSFTFTSNAIANVSGTVLKSLNSFTVNSNSLVDIKANSSISVNDFTLSSNSIIAINSLLSKTLDNITITSNGISNIAGNLSLITSDFILSSNSNVTIKSVLSKTLEDFSISSIAGDDTIHATSSINLEQFSITSNGLVAAVANVQYIIDDFNTNANSKIYISGSFSKTLEDFILNSNVRIDEIGSFGRGLDDFSILSIGKVNISANVDKILDDFIISEANTNIKIIATSQTNIEDVTANAIANQIISGISNNLIENFSTISDATIIIPIIGSLDKILNSFYLNSQMVVLNVPSSMRNAISGSIKIEIPINSMVVEKDFSIKKTIQIKEATKTNSIDTSRKNIVGTVFRKPKKIVIV